MDTASELADRQQKCNSHRYKEFRSVLECAARRYLPHIAKEHPAFYVPHTEPALARELQKRGEFTEAQRKASALFPLPTYPQWMVS